MKTIGSYRKDDGDIHVAYLVHMNSHARCALELLPALLTSETLRDCMSDEGASRIKLERAATLACDLAEKVLAEFDARDWLLSIPEPETIITTK